MTKYELALLTPSEQVMRSPAKLPNSNASLFTKATVFESLAIVHDPYEAGLDNEWLSQMGSTRFDDWTHTEADFSTWGDEYCSDDQVTDRSTMRFYTLPYCFERATYVVPKELPPWTKDMIDPSFAHNLSSPLLGSSICLDHTSAGRWRRKLSKEYLERLFAGAMSAIDDVEMNEGGPKAGRPKKVSAVASAYIELGLDRSDLSWKEKHALVSEHLGRSRADYNHSMRNRIGNVCVLPLILDKKILLRISGKVEGTTPFSVVPSRKSAVSLDLIST